MQLLTRGLLSEALSSLPRNPQSKRRHTQPKSSHEQPR